MERAKCFSCLVDEKIERMKNGVGGCFSHGPQILYLQIEKKWEENMREKNKITTLSLIWKLILKIGRYILKI